LLQNIEKREVFDLKNWKNVQFFCRKSRKNVQKVIETPGKMCDTDFGHIEGGFQ